MTTSGLPESWAVSPLGHLGVWNGGGTPTKSNPAFWKGDIPWVSPKDIKVARLWDSSDHLSTGAIEASATTVIPKGSVLVVTRSGILAHTLPIATNEVPLAINQDLKAITPFPGIDAEYLAWTLRGLERRILKECSKHGTTVHSVEVPRLQAFDVPVAPRQEQRRIVAKIEELFSELDKGIESLKAARRQLEVYRQSVLKQAFEGKLTAQWRKENKDKLETPEQLLARIEKERASHYERQLAEWESAIRVWETNGKRDMKPTKPRKPAGLAKLKSSELAELPSLPEGHVYTCLANLGELERGKSKHRPRNAPELFGGSYPFIQTGEVKAASRTIRHHSQTYSELGLEQSRLWPEGTLCITIAANIAETAFLGFDACFPDSIVGFTATKTLVLPSYVRLLIQSFRARIEAYAPATAQKNINLNVLQKLVVPLCSSEEQQVLVDRLEAILSVADEQERDIDRALVETEVLRQAILKKAFAGHLVAQDPSDEPASVLLEKVRTERAKAGNGGPTASSS